MRRRDRLWAVALVSAFTLVSAACGGGDGQADGGGGGDEEAIRAAFVYITSPGDGGWTFQHELGRQMVEEELGDQVVTTKIENVPEEPGTATRVIRQMAQRNDIVFTTSFGYMDPTVAVAEEFPDVMFEHCSGFKSADNMANYFGAMEEPRYLSGLVAGSMTKSNVVGYVAAFPIPEVVRGINAFALGVREANPQATVRVVWTSTWFDPAKERQAAESLLDANADVLAQHQDSPAVGQAAQERDAFWVGYDSDMRRFAEDAFLTAPVWNWGPYYVERIRAALEGTWDTQSYYGDMAAGIVDLAPLSDLVPDDVAQMVDDKRQAIIDGEFEVLQGPIRDQDGKVMVPEGEVMSLEDALGWQWFVEGVQGTIPKA